MSDCIFCKIAGGESSAHVVWEDKKHIAFLTIFPNTPGFTIVATKEHKPSYIFENDDETIKAIIIATKKVSKMIDKAFEDVARCGLFFEGYGVDHLHSKIFPMHGTVGKIEWEKLEGGKPGVFYDKYPGFLTSLDCGRANDRSLEKIASKIKKYA